MPEVIVSSIGHKPWDIRTRIYFGHFVVRAGTSVVYVLRPMAITHVTRTYIRVVRNIGKTTSRNRQIASKVTL